jgi:hypothetical protein
VFSFFITKKNIIKLLWDAFGFEIIKWFQSTHSHKSNFNLQIIREKLIVKMKGLITISIVTFKNTFKKKSKLEDHKTQKQQCIRHLKIIA